MDEREEIALLPCPFCGSPARRWNQARGVVVIGCEQSSMHCPVQPYITRSADEAVAAWNTRLARRTPIGWRTIESAPKDGTRVLLAWRSGRVSAGLWTLDEAWCSYPGSRYGDPTHWMPLPDPPAVSVRTEEGEGNLGDAPSLREPGQAVDPATRGEAS